MTMTAPTLTDRARSTLRARLLARLAGERGLIDVASALAGTAVFAIVLTMAAASLSAMIPLAHNDVARNAAVAVGNAQAAHFNLTGAYADVGELQERGLIETLPAVAVAAAPDGRCWATAVLSESGSVFWFGSELEAPHIVNDDSNSACVNLDLLVGSLYDPGSGGHDGPPANGNDLVDDTPTMQITIDTSLCAVEGAFAFRVPGYKVGYIDWGDDTATPFTPGAELESHTYAEQGIYTVTLNGTFAGFAAGSGAACVTAVSEFGETGTTVASFADAANLTEFVGIPSTLVDLSGMFAGATSFDQDVSGWDVSRVHTVAGMFEGATAFTNGGASLSGWDLSLAGPEQCDGFAAGSGLTPEQMPVFPQEWQSCHLEPSDVE